MFISIPINPKLIHTTKLLRTYPRPLSNDPKLVF